MLMIMSGLSSLAYKLLTLIFMLMLASLVKTELERYLDHSFRPAKGYDEHPASFLYEFSRGTKCCTRKVHVLHR